MKRFPESLRARLNHTRVEWVLVALLAGFCAVLSALQYRWTGEVSRAEAEHLRAGINEQAQQFSHAFDSVLTDGCQALMPHGGELNDGNREAVHAAQFEKWQAGNPRPLFSRIVIAVPAPDGVRLFEQNQVSGQLSPRPWPPEWDSLRQFLNPQSTKGPWPFEKSDGTTIMLPVSGRPPGKHGPGDAGSPARVNGDPDDGGPPHGPGPGGFDEWMIFELDSNYLHTVWLPELTRRYLNPDVESLNDVVIKTMPPPGKVIFATESAAPNSAEVPVKVPLNWQGREAWAHHGPGGEPIWELTVKPHPGALEAIVALSRLRNLIVAFLLNGLIFAAALALLHHTRRSRELAAAQMNFVAAVSHELRTPLTVIRGAGHNLLRGVAREPGQIEQYSRLIIQHAEQLTGMVEQILELAGVNKNSSAAVREPVALGDVLREAIAVTTQETQAAHCELRFELPPDLPAVIGDPTALRRVFQNLITNAAKHGGAGGWIGITAVNEANGTPSGMEVRVADRGPGIPAAELREIFKPFFRGADALKSQIRGSGLGLSLVKEIVEAHGGTVSAESQPGQGAVFIVRLPVEKK